MALEVVHDMDGVLQRFDRALTALKRRVGLVEMHVRVDERGGGEHAAGVDHFAVLDPFGADFRFDLEILSVVSDQDIGHSTPHNVRIADEQHRGSSSNRFFSGLRAAFLLHHSKMTGAVK